MFVFFFQICRPVFRDLLFLGAIQQNTKVYIFVEPDSTPQNHTDLTFCSQKKPAWMTHMRCIFATASKKSLRRWILKCKTNNFTKNKKHLFLANCFEKFLCFCKKYTNFRFCKKVCPE